jgi:hypothetical protein
MLKSVQLAHPLGASLAISESLSTFLLNCPNRGAPFFLGDWLASVDDAALKDLRQLAHAYRNGDNSPRTDDLLSTALIAQAAEAQRPDHQVDEQVANDWVAALYVAAALESYRRLGWLTLGSPLSIRPDVRVTVAITAEGWKHQHDLGRGLS